MSHVISRSTDAATITPDQIEAPFEAEDEGQSVLHKVLGRTYPDVTLRPMSAATGTLRLRFSSASEAEAARIFHRQAATYTVASPAAFLPARYVPTRVGRAQQLLGADVSGWAVEVDFAELSP